MFKRIYNHLRILNKEKKTPLHYAAENKSEDIGELLISKGANLNAEDIFHIYITIFFKINSISNY